MLEAALIMKDYMGSFCNVPSQVGHKYVHTKQEYSFVMQNITLRKNIISMKEFFSILERPILVVALLNYRSCRKLLFSTSSSPAPSKGIKAEEEYWKQARDVCGKKLKDIMHLVYPKITLEICLELPAMECVGI